MYRVCVLFSIVDCNMPYPSPILYLKHASPSGPFRPPTLCPFSLSPYFRACVPKKILKTETNKKVEEIIEIYCKVSRVTVHESRKN